jgi:hypothetical protein
MSSRSAGALLGLGLTVSWLLGLVGAATAVEPQKFDPRQCQTDDHSCVQAWYKEYSTAILQEFRYYTGQEGFLGEMLGDPNETLQNSRLALLLVEGMTKYSQWVVLTDDDAAEAAGLDMVKYKAATGECREASSKMREALFDLKGHREKVAIEAKEYLKNAAVCEKTFALAPARSKLRGNEVSTGAAGSGPMPIVPVKPPRR